MVSEKMKENNLAKEQLAAYVGVWHTSGQIFAKDATPSVPIYGIDSYEWLPGNYFLLHKVDVMIGDSIIKNTEIIGWDYQTANYFMHAYDTSGVFSRMQATVGGKDWVYEGSTEKFVGGFNGNGSIFSGIWYTLEKDTTWREWMEIKLEKE